MYIKEAYKKLYSWNKINVYISKKMYVQVNKTNQLLSEWISIWIIK